MRQQIKDLELFQITFNSTYNTKPALLPEQDWKLRYKLLEEELGEYKEACEQGDIVEISDALTDCLFIVLGSFVSHGLQDIAEELFAEVTRSNMSKTEEDGTVLINGVNAFDDKKPYGKILKSKRYSEPDLKSIIEKHYGI